MRVLYSITLPECTAFHCGTRLEAWCAHLNCKMEFGTWPSSCTSCVSTYTKQEEWKSFDIWPIFTCLLVRDTRERTRAAMNLVINNTNNGEMRFTLLLVTATTDYRRSFVHHFTQNREAEFILRAHFRAWNLGVERRKLKMYYIILY